MVNGQGDISGGRAAERLVEQEPFYLPQGNEVAISRAAWSNGLPLLLKGPTGCGKTRFILHLAWELKRPRVTVSCHDDLSTGDLVGRYLIRGGDAIWVDGPLTTAVRTGAICYLDEIVEARKDTTVVIHPLADERRELPIDKRGELLRAPPSYAGSLTTPLPERLATSSRARGSGSSRSSSASRRRGSRSRSCGTRPASTRRLRSCLCGSER
jgi:MoxR-like ATPase